MSDFNGLVKIDNKGKGEKSTQHQPSSSAGGVVSVEFNPPEANEWTPLKPTNKDMGLVPLVLDKGVKTTVIGQLYGLDFEIEGDEFSVRVFFDNYNSRLKVLDYHGPNFRGIVERLSYLAKENHFDKIFLKATKEDWNIFLSLGFMLEGILKYFFRGENAYVLSKFSSQKRLASENLIEESDIIENIMSEPVRGTWVDLPEGFTCIPAQEKHIPKLVRLYREVFKTYPSPLTHPDYIQQTMKRNIIYQCVLLPDGKLISAGSAEMNSKYSNAEMTDCATLKKFRGKGLMSHILSELEKEIKVRGIQTAYTLARGLSRGMNRVFYNLGYEYNGRLINNCDIYGQFEDMNIWVKQIK